MSDVYLCDFDEIPEPGSRGFSVPHPEPCEADAQPLSLFVVRRDNQLHAYRNRCPHTGAPLEWQPDQFLDLDNCFIQCAIHGALFGMDDGRCLRGPCVGQSLQPLPLHQRDGGVYLPADVELWQVPPW